MKKVTLLIFVFSIFLSGCFLDPGHPSPPPSCSDPCPNTDFSMMNIQNIDNVTIYVKYLNTSDGSYIIPNSSMISTSIAPNSSIKLNFRNDNFNHFYFYSNNTYTSEIGKFILANVQPLYSTMCNLRIRLNGNFTSAESNLLVTNSKNKTVCIRETQIPYPGWAFWNLSFPSVGTSEQLNGCTTHSFTSPSATNFEHIYFYQTSVCTDASENNNLSKLIFLNTKSEKINLPNIVIR